MVLKSHIFVPFDANLNKFEAKSDTPGLVYCRFIDIFNQSKPGMCLCLVKGGEGTVPEGEGLQTFSISTLIAGLSSGSLCSAVGGMREEAADVDSVLPDRPPVGQIKKIRARRALNRSLMRLISLF